MPSKENVWTCNKVIGELLCLFFLVKTSNKTKTTSSFFSADDMPSPNKDSVGKPVGFNAEKGNG